MGSVQAGTKSNVIPDHAVLQLNVRTYDERTRSTVLGAIERIVRAECAASGSPKEPEFELFDRYPAHRQRRRRHRPGRVAPSQPSSATRAGELPQQSASEDFSDLPDALGVPYTYWGIGGIDPDAYRAAEAAGRVAQDIPVNHSATLRARSSSRRSTPGRRPLVVAALAWLGR